jgi:hypothetical protein
MEKFTKIFFAAIFLITISSCDKKSCKNVACSTGMECYQGKCLCNDGFEGANCSTLSSDKYVGNYQVSENCGGSPPNFTGGYTVNIFSAGGSYSVNTIVLSNFLNAGNVYAYIQNTDPNNLGTTIYVPSQNPGSNIQISASYGTYYPAGTAGGVIEIIINMNYTYGGYNYQCQETLYKM